MKRAIDWTELKKTKKKKKNKVVRTVTSSILQSNSTSKFSDKVSKLYLKELLYNLFAISSGMSRILSVSLLILPVICLYIVCSDRCF